MTSIGAHLVLRNNEKGLNSNVLALIPSNFPTAPTAKLRRTREMAVFCGTALRVKARDVEF